MKRLVIIPGGFHPPHPGHVALYNAAISAFPDADVYVVASNDTNERPFPFHVKQQLADLAGIPKDRFKEVSSPFRPKEIVDNYDSATTQLIFVRSDKDKGIKPIPGGKKKDGTPAYLQPFTSAKTSPLSKHAYIAYLPTITFNKSMRSASEIRNSWDTLPLKKKESLVSNLYPVIKNNKRLVNNVVNMLDVVLQPVISEETKSTKDNKDKKDKKDNKPDLIALAQKDPELRDALLRSITHYTQHTGDPEMAFMKLVQRNLRHTMETDAKQNQQISDLERRVQDLEKSTITNEGDIIPDGGMGSWDETSLQQRLTEKLLAIVDMLRKKDYSGVKFAWNDPATKAMINSLANLE